ncbi:MAG TPA: OmpA family protein [Bryobacterales bacterium]|nr:OmpA family protein [Bryobacterales bacterium]
MTTMKMLGAFLAISGFLSAQTPRAPNDVFQLDTTPVFRVTSVGRTAKAINYRHRGGATKIDFAGTSLMPNARGEAKVESKQGYIEIEVEFDDLQPAVRNGAEYLTYVMWAITPEGRTANLGEVLLNGTKSKLNVTTELQVFGLVVTAEPYFSVTRPSDLVVMENVVRKDTAGKIEQIDAKYELLRRGEYTRLTNPLELKLDRKVPLELYEARNAVQIARASGADRYATETFQKAENSLQQAEAYQSRKAGKKQVTMTARQAVQTAEDSRAIAVQRQEEESLANERQAAAEREMRAEDERAAAEAEAARVTRNAETARVDAENEADRLRRDNEARTAANQLEADRLRRDNDAQRAAAETAADRLRQENNARTAAAEAEADRLKRDNDDQRAAARAELDRAASERARAEAEKSELRDQLRQQFNAILETRDSARGLIVNMSDVLFDTGKYSLRSAAREKLAKVVGVISGHRDLKLEVEGHTDNVGSDEYNQRLSEQRAEAVRNFLTEQGMSSSSITTRGLGEGQPVASNDSTAGRQQNRRVELVVSGASIGEQTGTPSAAAR